MPADLANSLKADEDRKSDHTTLVQVKEEKVVTDAATTETKLQRGDLGVGVDSLSEIQTCVAPAEIWLRDVLEKVYALLFRFLGYGFRLGMRDDLENIFVLPVGNGFQLALCNVSWLVTQKFVNLVPDPIIFTPWPVLFGRGEPCVTAIKTLHILWCCAPLVPRLVTCPREGRPWRGGGRYDAEAATSLATGARSF